MSFQRLTERRAIGECNWAHLVLLGIALLSAGCERNKSPANTAPSGESSTAWFQDITTESRLKFLHDVTLTGDYLIPEQMGSGCALFDYDNDGRLDVYLIHNIEPGSTNRNRLFHQERDGRFKDVSRDSGLDVTGYGMAVLAGDVNNDGWLDILITENGRSRLFRNPGGTGKFQEVSREAGLLNEAWGVPAAFVDYDRDGWLDIVIANYVVFDPAVRYAPGGVPDFCGPNAYQPTLTRLYHNVTGKSGGNGAAPRFEDITTASGLGAHPGKGMGIMCADFDGDHWPDILVSDDDQPNRLFINQRNGTFAEQAIPRGLAFTVMGATASNMGVAVGDIDGNGLFDVMVPHMAEEKHCLWMQGPAGVYEDRSAAAGFDKLLWHGTGFGPVLADFNNDGFLDLAISNGAVRNDMRARQAPMPPAQDVPAFWRPYAQPNQIFANDGKGEFQDISGTNPALCGQAKVARGMACGDIDNDGGLDLVINYIGMPAGVYRNTARGRGHWLGLRAVDPALGGRDAYGAEVIVQSGDRHWWRLLQPCYSYCSSNDPRLHFGLAQMRYIDSIRIIWPDGVIETFPGTDADRYLTIRKGSGKTQPESP